MIEHVLFTPGKGEQQFVNEKRISVYSLKSNITRRYFSHSGTGL